MRQTRQFSLARTLSLLAAACVAVLIVGSMLVLSNLLHQSQTSHPSVTGGSSSPTASGDNLPRSIYTSNGTAVFRLNAQSHQALWQRDLKNVADIVPAGNLIYILQSDQSPTETNAVVALNARDGSVLWTHPFPFQDKLQTDAASTTALVLNQGHLYVGWQTWTGVGAAQIDGQIFVLDASTGSQQAVYHSGEVEALAVGEGIIAVSGDYSLKIYATANGKPLWRQTYQAGSSAPVRQLSIVDDRVYALISTNNETSGEGEAYIATYDVNSGKQTWQGPAFPGDSLSRFTVNGQAVYFATWAIDSTRQHQPQTGSVYAYSLTSHKQLWRTSINGGGQGPLIVNNGILYVGADNGSDLHAHLVALDATTGKLKWQDTLTGDFIENLVVNNDAVYASSTSYQLAGEQDSIEAFSTGSGQMLWQDTQHGFRIASNKQ